jgi:hypothetical protein
MSFKRLDPEDFLISADSITAGAWTGGSATLTNFHKNTSQESSDSGKYYLTVYNTSDYDDVNFNIAYGNSNGSGSVPFNSNIAGKSPSSTIYGQFQNIVTGDEDTDFIFGDHTGSRFYALTLDRGKYKGSILPGNMTLTLESGSEGANQLSQVITDNSKAVSTTTFNNAGRVFQLVSGSEGTVNTSFTNGYTEGSGSYGFFLPDVGILLLNADALDAPHGEGGLGMGTTAANTDNTTNYNKLFTAISGAANFKISSQEKLTSDYVFIRARNSEFNYSTNPSFSSGSTGDVTFTEFISSPQTYITTVGLYNDENELLATAKLSKPLKKDFTKEALIRVKLDF